LPHISDDHNSSYQKISTRLESLKSQIIDNRETLRLSPCAGSGPAGGTNLQDPYKWCVRWLCFGLHYSLTCSSMGSASASRSISVKPAQRSSNKRENNLCYSCITLRMCIDFTEGSTAVYLSLHISHHTRHCGAQAYVHLSLGFEPTWPSLLCCPQLLHRVVSTGLLQSWHSQCWSRRSWLTSGVSGPQRQSTAKPRAFAREVWPRGHEVPAARPARGGSY
jgi:hypothetical protein